MPQGGGGAPGDRTTSRLHIALKRGLYVFSGFFGAAILCYILTFMWFRRIDGPMELPLPVWIMLLPTLVALGSGVLTSLIVMVVNLARSRPHWE